MANEIINTVLSVLFCGALVFGIALTLLTVKGN